ncbi:MAG: EamA family transporter, partial [bacterium]|nr:EamA family transporter [bacterium]
MHERPKPAASTIAAYAVMCLIWGTTWLVIKVSLVYVPAFTAVGLRFLVAGAALAALARARGVRDPIPWKLVAVLATFLFGVNYLLTYTAETRLDSGLVAVLFGTLPFFMFAMGAIAHERTTPRIWIGAAVAFGGVAVISLASQVQASPFYALAAIGAALSSAFANLYAKRHAHHDPLRTLPPSMLLAGGVILVLGIVTEHPNWSAAVQPRSLLALGYLALVGSGLAFFLNLRLLQRIASWIVGLSSLVIPVIAVGVGVFFGGEHVTARELLGSALVVAGLAVALTG